MIFLAHLTWHTSYLFFSSFFPCRDTEGDTVTVPAEVGDDLGGVYDWGLQTVEQEFLGGRAVTLNQGKVVGGGTILNGMVWTRGSAKDYEAWDDLNDLKTQPERYRWRWSDLLPYFQKVRDPDHSESTAIKKSRADSYHGRRARTTLWMSRPQCAMPSTYIPT